MPLNRRTFLGTTAAAGAGVAVAGGTALPAEAETRSQGDHGHGRPPKRYAFSVMGTTDLHGHVFNWDYFTDKEYDDAAHNDVGLAKISTLVDQVRKEKGRHNTLLIDAGDIIQGTQLSYYYARVEPITGSGGKRGPKHPMALAMNHMRYDAAALGNHEFNYGIPTLRAFQDQLDFPLLGANALDAKTLKPAFPPYTVRCLKVPHGPDVKVGILGLTNPGIAIWDKANVQGKMTFPGLVEQAKIYVPKLRALGCDVVICTDHSGLDGSTSYGDALPYPENASSLVAEQVPGIDAILVGHTHKEVASRTVVNKETGKSVVLSEPYMWGMRLSVFDFALEFSKGRWHVTSVTAEVRNANAVAEDPVVKRLVKAEHDKVVAYVNQVVGTNGAEMRSTEAPYKDVPIIDLINHIQAETVKAALASTEYKSLPVLSQAACFSRSAVIPAGKVTIRDVAGLYVYENTLEARLLTGAQVRAYLEFSANYYVQTTGTVDPAKITNANSTPDYNYDVVSGVSYEVDIAKPAGSRVSKVMFDGKPLDDKAQFVLAVNNYRANGGGNFPGVATAKQLWANSDEIRNTMIAWVKAKGVIDQAEFASVDWKLTQNGVAVF
ncbi:bifunctional metallophosphatase/5'-nucleotidase [Streptomyces violascens]|uniref:Multifunctional 2',3'-cyclic-nucleotide 2'-phosphodiesterase/5'-nucleotidase/3'-nucleotidase n=1 Tax=Streptomyces violascens TaxID=67381 RepID=A0ABQ3QJH5_9ACTN|nr:5'-nucleotidase C-terminal domain-containing protein [Streptomyces violascens]GGT95927.1 multifunctional 2',3'-cyclic-nucleotide 2'-phosphodiesterase/5'-nucleotidase/3'-nucleotidase [Streptomyces violascens]GHI37418.1 multifunctional 2',3'-cyclic-nucleotide 2'-phosphodiesterase/5'-nucleotidase/3'-nucleotidase [Streptomyces violascens]